jgi:hypothetical protein
MTAALCTAAGIAVYAMLLRAISRRERTEREKLPRTDAARAEAEDQQFMREW